MRICKLLSVNVIKLLLINVKKVNIPTKRHNTEEPMIQLKFLIVLNILNKSNNLYKYNIS